MPLRSYLWPQGRTHTHTHTHFGGMKSRNQAHTWFKNLKIYIGIAKLNIINTLACILTICCGIKMHEIFL